MKNYIDGIDFFNLEIMKYYAPSTSWSEEKKKENAMSKIFSGEWYGARKRDGALYVFVKDEDGNCYLRGRSKSVSGEFLDKIDLVPHLQQLWDELPNGTCLLGELYLPRNEQAKTTTSIMNCLTEKAIARQKKEEDKLHYYVFDILADEGESFINMKAIDRFLRIEDYSKKYDCPYVEWAIYYSGKELWNELQNILAEGGEGMVITYGEAPYQPGKRSAKVSLKVKKEIKETIDCVIIGANPPTKVYTGKEPETWPFWFSEITGCAILAEDYLNKEHHTIYEAYVNGAPIVPVTKGWFYGWAGSLKLGLYDGDKLVHVGDLSGITDEIKENWRDYVGNVAEVSCMEILDTGGLRHPKFLGWRGDKAATDCLISQIR